MSTHKVYGAVELGGTKTICGIGTPDSGIQDYTIVPTEAPSKTLKNIISYFDDKGIRSLAIGSFGPLNLNADSPEYGCILNSPKTDWKHVNIRTLLSEHLAVKTYINSDVQLAGIGESTHGNAKNVNRFIYITIGTGIGATLITKGRVDDPTKHAEMGHIRIPLDFTAEYTKAGSCIYHHDCFEGIASGAALHSIYGQKAELLEKAEAWDTEAKHIAYALHNISMIMQPDCIVLGGGVMKHEGLLEKVRSAYVDSMQDYVEKRDVMHYIRPSSNELNAIFGGISIAAAG